MRMQTPYQAYEHANETVDPTLQIIMLYDKAICYVKQAKAAIELNDHNTRFQKVNETLSIIRGLRNCLDFSGSEHIADAMDKYYESIDNLLVNLQCEPSTKLCDGIITNLRHIKNIWEEINIKNSDVSQNDNAPQS